MRYVLHTAPNECSYTSFAKMNNQICTCLTTGTGFMSTKLLLFSISTLHEHFLLKFKLSSFVSVFGILLLQLSEFHVNCVNDCLYCISGVVCYNVEELIGMMPNCNMHLWHFLLVYFSKNVKTVLENEKSFVKIKPVSVVEHVEIWQFAFAKVV